MSTRLSGIFFCSTLLIIGSIVLLKQMSLDYNTVIYASQFSIIGAVIAGLFGFYIGKILETSISPRNKKRKPNKSFESGVNNLEEVS